MPQLAERKSGKKSGPAEEKETIFWGGVRRGDSFPVCSQKAEHCLNELQRWVQAMAISLDHRDRHEMLTLLLQTPRMLCASTGHYPHHHRTLCNKPLPGYCDPGTSSLEKHMVHLRLLQYHASLCHRKLTPHSNYNYCTPPSPGHE